MTQHRRPNIRAMISQANIPSTETSAGTPPVQSTQSRKELKSKRDRRSLYMDDETLAKLNDAYKQFNHDAFPQEIKKVSFLGAIVTIALSHGDELRDHLLSPRQE